MTFLRFTKTGYRNIAAGIVIGISMWALASIVAQEKQTKTLYERLGGYDGISAVVDDFAERLFKDDKISQFFRGMSTDTKEAFKQKNKNLLAAVTGGPAKVISRDAKTAHAGLKITEGDFKVVAGHLKDTLDKFKVPKKEQDEVFAIIDKLKPDIVERKTDELSKDADTVGAATFTKDGELIRPTGYRKWVFVGAPVTPHDMNDGKASFPEFHNVYIDTHSYDEYVQTGKYRDGTVIVKELVSVGGKSASSGKGYFQGEFIGLEALVKSTKFAKDEPGNWAFFSFTAAKGKPIIKTAKAFPTATCNSCHAEANEDYVFSEYYPVLRAAKGKGEHSDR